MAGLAAEIPSRQGEAREPRAASMPGNPHSPCPGVHKPSPAGHGRLRVGPKSCPIRWRGMGFLRPRGSSREPENHGAAERSSLLHNPTHPSPLCYPQASHAPRKEGLLPDRGPVSFTCLVTICERSFREVMPLALSCNHRGAEPKPGPPSADSAQAGSLPSTRREALALPQPPLEAHPSSAAH